MAQFSPWHDGADLLSHDGRFRASMVEAHELRMGSPTSGVLAVSLVETGEVLIQLRGCNPSMVWSSQAADLFFPRWTKRDMQNLCKLNMETLTVYYHRDLFNVLELHGHHDGQLYLTDSPIHKPENLTIADTDVDFEPKKANLEFLKALGYQGQQVSDVRDAIYENRDDNFLLAADRIAYLNWFDSRDDLASKLTQLTGAPQGFFSPLKSRFKAKQSLLESVTIYDGFLVKEMRGKIFLIDLDHGTFAFGVCKTDQYRELMRAGRALSMKMKPVDSEPSMIRTFLLSLVLGFHWPLALGLSVLVVLGFVITGKKQLFNAQCICNHIGAGLVFGATFGSPYWLDSLPVFWLWKFLIMALCSLLIFVGGLSALRSLAQKFGLDDFKLDGQH